MSDTTISIPLSQSLKQSAEAASRLSGFASLQDALLEFVKRFSKREVTLEPGEKSVHLSKRNEKRYAKIVEDIKMGRNVTKTKNVDELLKLLHS